MNYSVSLYVNYEQCVGHSSLLAKAAEDDARETDVNSRFPCCSASGAGKEMNYGQMDMSCCKTKLSCDTTLDVPNWSSIT